MLSLCKLRVTKAVDPVPSSCSRLSTGTCAYSQIGRLPLMILRASRSPADHLNPEILNSSTSGINMQTSHYEDSLADQAVLMLFANKMAERFPGVKVPFNPSYKDVVEMTRQIYKGSSRSQLRQLVGEAMDSLLPPHADIMLQTLLPLGKYSAELDAQITKNGFGWLVGSTEIQPVEVDFQGHRQVWHSRVKIKKCRYLEASGCVGMCTNLCKIPTQDFFARTFGMPVTMEPNFDDLSCTCTFGHPAPPPEEDPACSHPCFQTCSVQKFKHSMHQSGSHNPHAQQRGASD